MTMQHSKLSILAVVLLPAFFSLAAADSPRTIRCATQVVHAEKVAAARTTVRASRGGPSLSGQSKLMTPPANPNVGDSWNWYIWSLNGPPTATLQSCTVRGEGASIYVVVEDSQWGLNVTQAKIDTILARFESHSPGPYPTMGIYDIDTTAFGLPPDELDSDPKIYLLYYNFDVAADGFFWAFDEYPDGSQAYASNECEVVYLNSFGSGDVAGDFMLAVAGHEFEHLIHWNYDEDEDAWVDEGLAELAMWMYGNPDNISGFNANPNDPLVTWGGAWTDYIQTYLWSLYFFEQYGGIPSVRAVVAEPKNSVNGYDQVLVDRGYSEQFTDVFGDWGAANFLDDPTIGDGRYGYVGDDLPPFICPTNSTYPVGPLTRNTNPTACKYRRLADGTPMDFYVDCSDDAIWELTIMLYDGAAPVDAFPFPVDSLNDATYFLSEFGTTYDSVVVAFAHASTWGGNGFTVGTTFPTGVPPSLIPGVAALLPNRPNPFNPATKIEYNLPDGGSARPVELAVYDLSGRLVRTLVDGLGMPGLHSITWDGSDGAGRSVSSGVYHVRLTWDGRMSTRKLQLIR